VVQTTELIDIAYYAGFITILLAIPLVCILDIKYREVPNWLWFALTLPNIPFLYVMYSEGLPLTYLAISLGLLGVYLALWNLNWIGGADAKFLSVIAIIVPLTPFSYEPFAITFYICLVALLVCVPFAICIRNSIMCKKAITMKERWTYWKGGIPYMIPISIAFLVAVFV
jgi:Flp pilus assembly protein protease CpaA